MNKEELKKKITDILNEEIDYVVVCESSVKYVCIDHIADALISAGFGDVKAMKEIKYRVRRAEKALYIACRETAEIIFKDDFDRHAQEYMYGYLKQAEKELAEENNGFIYRV